MSVLEIKNLSVFYGSTQALSDVCLTVEKGDFLGIIGPNGGGKTTLLKAVLGLTPVKSGTIKLDENGIGYVPQFAALEKNFPITALEVVLTGMLKNGLHPFFSYSQAQKQTAWEKLDLVGLSALAQRQISDLSGGELQRLLIARALATEPELLLLDEPTASVDPASKENIYTLLERLNKDKTIILVTHDTLAISSKVRSIACLNKTLVYHGKPQLSEETINSVYECPVDLIAHGVPHRVFKEHDCGGSHD